MKEFINLINNCFDGNFFEVKEYSIPQNMDEDHNMVYCIDVIYITDGSFAQRTKFHYKDKISEDKAKDIRLHSKECMLRNIMFSKETNGNCIDPKFGTPIKMFADYKKEILELKKNKANE